MNTERCTALVLFWTKTGNTRKVAEAIRDAAEKAGVAVTVREITAELSVDFFDYHFVFLGVPVYGNLPPKPATEFLSRVRSAAGDALPAAPERPGHFAVPFCTYGGGHTGFREAEPCLKYVGQTFEHMGIRVVEEWAVVGEFTQASAAYNEAGRLGNVRSRPNEHDLAETRGKVLGLFRRLQHHLPIDASKL